MSALSGIARVLPGLVAASLHLGLALCVGLPDESKSAPNDLEIELDFEMPTPADEVPKVSASSDTLPVAAPEKHAAASREILTATARTDTPDLATTSASPSASAEATLTAAAADLDAGLLDASGTDSRIHHSRAHVATLARPTTRFVATRGPRLLSSSPSCSDLFARASLGAGTLALVDVDSHGSARLSRLLGDDHVEPGLLDASRACVERLSFEPARDEKGEAHEGTARLRLRPSSEG